VLALVSLRYFISKQNPQNIQEVIVGLAQIGRGLECTLDAVDLVEAEAEAG